MTFTDLSKNQIQKIPLSKNFPSYRTVCKGTNIFGLCTLKSCPLFNKEVVIRIRTKTFDLIKQRDSLKCPSCDAIIIPKTMGFILCKYSIYGKKVVDDKVIPFENGIKEAKDPNNLEYFDPEFNGEVIFLSLIAEVIETY